MSIIYATLERVERDTPPPVYDSAKSISPPVALEPRGLPLKSLATTIMVVIAGAGLMFWYRSGEVAAPLNFAPVAAAQQTAATGTSDHPSPASIGEQAATVTVTESTRPDSAVAVEHNVAPAAPMPIEQEVEPAVPAPAEIAVVTAKQDVAAQETSPAPEPLAGPVTAAEVKAEPASPPVAKVVKPATASPAADEPQQPGAGDTAARDGIEAAIEQARLALSRGRYQQALSALEPLEPVPENRVDFWFIKGSAHLGLGQLDLAETAFASAQALAPNNAQLAVQQAILKQEQGDHASALQILEDAAIRHPNMPEIFLNRGYSQQALGAVRDARRSFRIFLNLTEGRSLYSQQRAVVEAWLAQASSIQG